MKGFKTVAFGLMIAALSILSNPEMQQFIAANIPAVGGSIGTAIIILRAVTKSPIFKNGKPDA